MAPPSSSVWTSGQSAGELRKTRLRRLVVLYEEGLHNGIRIRESLPRFVRWANARP
jgi:hypothetical protein